MYCGELADAGVVEPFECSEPEAKLGVDWIFDEDGDVNAFEGIGNFLDEEGIDGCSCTNPEDVDSGV